MAKTFESEEYEPTAMQLPRPAHATPVSTAELAGPALVGGARGYGRLLNTPPVDVAAIGPVDPDPTAVQLPLAAHETATRSELAGAERMTD